MGQVEAVIEPGRYDRYGDLFKVKTYTFQEVHAMAQNACGCDHCPKRYFRLIPTNPPKEVNNTC